MCVVSRRCEKNIRQPTNEKAHEVTEKKKLGQQLAWSKSRIAAAGAMDAEWAGFTARTAAKARIYLNLFDSITHNHQSFSRLNHSAPKGFIETIATQGELKRLDYASLRELQCYLSASYDDDNL